MMFLTVKAPDKYALGNTTIIYLNVEGILLQNIPQPSHGNLVRSLATPVVGGDDTGDHVIDRGCPRL